MAYGAVRNNDQQSSNSNQCLKSFTFYHIHTTVKVLLPCTLYLKPFLCLLSLKSFTVKERETPCKTENPTPYSLYKGKTISWPYVDLPP